MAYPHCCTCTDSPIMGTGSNKVNRQCFLLTAVSGLLFKCCLWLTSIYMGHPKVKSRKIKHFS